MADDICGNSSLSEFKGTDFVEVLRKYERFSTSLM